MDRDENVDKLVLIVMGFTLTLLLRNILILVFKVDPHYAFVIALFVMLIIMYFWLTFKKNDEIDDFNDFEEV